MANKETEEVAVSDINNPPKAPYVFEPFPTTVYKLKPPKEDKAPKEWDNKIVHNEKELKEAEGKGWVHKAPNPEEPEAESAEKPAAAPAKK